MNIILIGMPGSGKSTTGVILAKELGMGFIDTDLYIQKESRRTLQTIINDEGMACFEGYENRALLSVNEDNCVVATGGSAVFCEEGMGYLAKNGTVIYLNIPISIIKRRLTNIESRGIAAGKGETIEDIYKIRKPLYERYADITVKSNGGGVEIIVNNIKRQLQERNIGRAV